MDHPHPYLIEKEDHDYLIEYLEEASELLCLMDKVDKSNKPSAISEITHKSSDFCSLQMLIGMLTEKIDFALEVSRLSKSTYNPDILFEHLFDKMKFTSIGEGNDTYAEYFFRRFMEKWKNDQKKEIQLPEKDDADLQPEDENEDPDKIEKPVQKIFPAKQTIDACEIQLKVAGNMLREMKESINPENQENCDNENEATA